MQFTQFAQYLKQIETTSSRLTMTETIAKMLKETTKEEIGTVVNLALGQMGPPYADIDFNISTKLMQKIIATAYKVAEELAVAMYKNLGDYGDVSFELAEKNSSTTEGSVNEVYQTLKKIGELEGTGSQQEKIDTSAELLQSVDPLSAKYITRIILKKLRVGFSDMTVLDALSWMETGGKGRKKDIERAYNVSADIGFIATMVKEKGIDHLDEVAIRVGTPIRPAAAERQPSALAIVEKLGIVAAEPKIDGFRLQVHYQKGKTMRLFSRNLEDMSAMFPEIVTAVQQLPVDSVILEGEAVAYNADADEFLPFQETISRRRKHDIKEKASETPLTLFVFELMYLNGERYIDKTYTQRRTTLEEILKDTSHPEATIQLAESQVFEDGKKLSEYFLATIDRGLEGIMCKRLDAPYAAGARNSNWIKLKREEKTGELDDSIDCVVLGYKMGTGKRAQFGIGAFLVGVYDKESDTFKSITNVGTGLTDEQWREMKTRADEIKANHKPARYDVAKDLEQDVWCEPEMVVEILADEITRSPNHTAGKNIGEDGLPAEEAGYALRFPRLVKWRDDKKAEDATSVKEIIELYKMQGK